jgi:hypothetical protein
VRTATKAVAEPTRPVRCGTEPVRAGTEPEGGRTNLMELAQTIKNQIKTLKLWIPRCFRWH